MKNDKLIYINKMCENLLIPNEFDDENDFWKHPVYDNYEANRYGIIRNVFNKKSLGQKDKFGYYRFDAYIDGKSKNFLNHRFIYECFNGLITDSRVIDHINNIKSDNRLENLQLITQRENCKKDAKEGRSLPPIRVRAINIETGESFDYQSIYKAARELSINPGLIYFVLKGYQKKSNSKKYNTRFTFEKLHTPLKYDKIPKIKIKLNIYKNKNVTINIDEKFLRQTEKAD